MSAKPRRLRYETERLKDGPMTVQEEDSPAVYGLEDDPEYRFDEPVYLDATLRLVGASTVLLMGEVRTVAKNECARCLEPLRIPLSAKVTLTYMIDERLLDPDKYPELADDDTHHFDGDAIYPADHLRELLLLELPTVPACELQPGDICPVRGVKLAPLTFGPAEEFEKELKSKQEDEDSLAGKLKKLRGNLG